jgi:phosphoribosylformylglycinamidine synthase
VAHSGREREVIDIFRKWDLDAVVVGRVREHHNMRVMHNGQTVADIPVSSLTDEAPLYERPMRRPEISGESTATPNPARQIKDLNDALLKLMATPNLASKQHVYRSHGPDQHCCLARRRRRRGAH